MNTIAKLKRANKLLQAIEFDTKEAYDTYMKEHPAANPQNHRVKPQQQKQQEKIDSRVTDEELNVTWGADTLMDVLNDNPNKATIEKIALETKCDYVLGKIINDNNITEDLFNKIVERITTQKDNLAFGHYDHSDLIKIAKKLNTFNDDFINKIVSSKNSGFGLYEAAERLAKSKRLSSEQLDALYEHCRDPKLKGLVAKNPKTSSETISKITNEVCNKPNRGTSSYISSEFIEHPNMTTDSLERLSKCENTRLKIMAQNQLQKISGGQKTQEQLLYEDKLEKHEKVKKMLIENNDENISKLFSDWGNHFLPETYELICDYGIKNNLLNSPHYFNTFMYYGDNHKLSGSTIKKLIDYLDNHDEIIETWSYDWRDEIKPSLLCAQNCPIDILENYSTNANKKFREAVAENKNAPQHILEKLSDDTYFATRSGVARNINASQHILEKLSNDKNTFVRKDVAENSKTPIKIVQKLAKDSNPKVQQAAEKALKKREKEIQNSIDFSKMSPKLREIFKDLSPEEQQAFLIWLKNKNGSGPSINTEEEIM